MKHVFVETNWIVEYCAPKHVQSPEALELGQKARRGEARLYLPSVCLTEARQPIQTKYTPRNLAGPVRKYLRWAEAEDMDTRDAVVVQRFIDQYEAFVKRESENVGQRLLALRSHPGMEVFPLSDEMLERALELAADNLFLRPFDQAILAAVLVKAEALRREGIRDVSFCEIDGDLQPWDKRGKAKDPLASLYDGAAVWVYGDFALQKPPRRPSFGV